jgi:hypothetical protein
VNGYSKRYANKVTRTNPMSPQLQTQTKVSAKRYCTPAQTGLLRRKCACGTHAIGGKCEECEKQEGLLQRASLSPRGRGIAGEGQVPRIVHEVLRSPGQPLDGATRSFFEPRFGHDFSQVRVHTDTKAAESAGAVNARAYTSGNAIVFGNGQFATDSDEGKRLLGHELTHVVQTASLGEDPARVKVISLPGDRSEEEADTIAKAVTNNDSSVQVAASPTAVIQRDTSDTFKTIGIVGGIVAGAGLAGLGIAALAGAFEGKPKGEDKSKQSSQDKEGEKKQNDEQAPLVTFEQGLEEGATILQPEFGKTAGQSAGVDPADGYDASEWKEVMETGPQGGRHYIEPTIASPWLALKHMFQNLGKPVPKAGGGTTKWSFDCFEFVEVLHLFARWRSMERKKFEEKFSKLRIGFFSSVAGEWKRPFKADRPADKPYTEGELKMTTRGGVQVFEPTKQPAGKSWKDLLKDAPPGSQVIWTNEDAKRKCKKDPSLSFCEAWQNENATKLGLDRYSAHPFGVKNEAFIKQAMAEAVVDPVPPGYIEKNIYISAILYPAEPSTPARPGGASDGH